MEKRALGKSGIEIPPLVFGGNVFGWTADQAASFRLLDALVDAGFNAIDTADMYSTWVPGHQGGESETVIGNWLKQRGGRDKLSIFETDLEPLCRAEEVGVINYYALASGFLTGKYGSEADLSKSPRGAGVKKYLDARGRRILKVLDNVAASHAATPGQVAIAWLIARPSVTAPIASATSVDQLQDLLKAAALKLKPKEIEALNQASG